MINIGVRLRPDPLLVWASENRIDDDAPTVRLVDALRAIVRAPRARLALMAMLVGRYADRHGRIRSLRLGGLVLLVAGLLSALATNNVALMFAAMWALGFGWTLGLVGGSSLLSDSVPLTHRVPVQGAADLTMSVCGGIAGVMSGFVMDVVGFATLALISSAATLIILVAAFAAANDGSTEVTAG
jgi:MFS family permease